MELVIFWIGINALVGYAIGKQKSDVGGAIAISILLGPLGWVIAILSGGNLRKCPFCAESVKPEAKVCRFCGRDLPPPPVDPKSLLQPPPVKKPTMPKIPPPAGGWRKLR